MKNILLSSLFCFCFFIQPSNAQLIESMEGALSGISESSGGGSDFEDWLFLIDFLWYPTYGLMIGFEGEAYPNEIEFARYPYESKNEGIYRQLSDPGYRARAEFNLHFQSNEDDLFGAYAQLRYSPARFLNLEINHLRLFESVDNQDVKTDQLAVTNVSVQYNRIRHHRLQMWWGLGLMAVSGEEDYLSPSFVAGGVWYFAKPLSLAADTQVGYPNGVVATQAQVKMQVHLERYKVFAGYQGTRFGAVFVPNWMFGAGVHF